MSVAFDAFSTDATFSAATSASNTGLTIAATATALLAFWGSIATTVPSNLALTWNGVSMTLLGSYGDSTINSSLAIFGLVNPATGNQTLAATWTGSTTGDLLGMSFTGTDTSSVANAFQNFNKLETASGTSATITNTGATNNINVAAGVQNHFHWNSISATGSTTDFNNTSSSNEAIAIGHAPSASSIVWTFTTAGATVYELFGVDVCVPQIPQGYPFRRKRVNLTL